MRPTQRLTLPILKRSSYYDEQYRQSPALIRARRPYIFKNMITGIAIAGFAISVFAFTIKAVGQEDFSDVIVPEEAVDQRRKLEAGAIQQPPKTPNVQSNGVR